MSSQIRNDRRANRSRFPAQGSRREWVPRGSTAITTGSSTAGVVNSLSSFNSNHHENSRESNYIPAPWKSGHSENSAQSLYQKGGKERGNNQKDKGLKCVSLCNQEQKGLEDTSLPKLLQEIEDKLMKGTVECMICYDMVRRSAPIWSCSSCYSIFHMNCVKKWARAPTSVDLSAEKNQGFNWRCPGCQSVQFRETREIQYLCFCGKRLEPPPDLYLTPHSCGETCGKPLDQDAPGAGRSKGNICPHVCVLQCHPGPCPPCKAFAPPRLCPCGKKVISTRCADRNSFFSCGQRCQKLLGCWRHRCEQVCHVGQCHACQVMINATCFCKKKTEVVLCGEIAVKGEMKVENGIFSCNLVCGKQLTCQNHVCNEICHLGPCGECDLLPGRIKACYCGKTNLHGERLSCLDPIPTCSQICGKSLPCGLHQCKDMCHAGNCAPCTVFVTERCGCRATSRTVECHKTMMGEERFTCDKPCGQKKNCGRHRCSEKCCPLSNSNISLSGDWDPHLCSMPCGKKLRCGQHACKSLCHSGHCPQCLETIFTDLTCACGRTSIPPPQPCGTHPPVCQYFCSVSQPCGHSFSHICHFGDCPPCSVPIAKECSGGHVVIRNIPCGSKDIRCNNLCGKTRQCGRHACARTCHPPPCDSSCRPSVSSLEASCLQRCGAPRTDCRHTCIALCHPSSPCPDVRCEVLVAITCSCGRITSTVPCDVGGNSGGPNIDTVFEASVMQKLPVPLQPVEASGKNIPLGQRKLTCDDECAKTARMQVLAGAFGVIAPKFDALPFGENSMVPEVLSDLLRRDPKWVLSVEERCKFLVLGKVRGGSGALRVHIFCPMLKEKRDAVWLIAERWKLSINVAGWEPKRFILVHVTPKSKAPSRVLGTKGSTPVNTFHPPVFDPLTDMDPKLVVTLFDLPRDADISALVLRFGGECELVWLNDKNALAVFSDPARAATAMRRLEQGSMYYGAIAIPQNGVALMETSGTNRCGGTVLAKDRGSSSVSLKGNPWMKAVVQEHKCGESSWGGEEWSADSSKIEPSLWKGKDAPIATSANQWNVLDSTTTDSSSAGFEDPAKWTATQMVSDFQPETSCSNMTGHQEANLDEMSDVVDDWEKAYDLKGAGRDTIDGVLASHVEK